MKINRAVLKISALILVLSIALGIFSAFIISYAKENTDVELDEKLFLAADSSKSCEYLAIDGEGNTVTVYSSVGADGVKYRRDLSEIPKCVIDAFLSAEDREFYNHNGVNFKRTALAALNFILAKMKGEKRAFGASTVTQQVIKNISGDNGYSLKRKLNEIIRAIRLEKRHSKDEILQMYLNIVPMSDNIYGVGAAAQIFFDKEPCQLTVPEAATLAAITNSPARYNPYTHPEECIKKRNNVLYAMYDFGKITREEYESYKQAPLAVEEREASAAKSTSNWFVETAREDIIRDLCLKYGATRAAASLMLSSGARVMLTENIEAQRILEEYFRGLKFETEIESAMLITDSISGDLLAIVGAAGEKRGELLKNYCLAPRAPGSTLKPIALYAPLIEERALNWSSMLEDEPISFVGEGEEKRGYPKNSPDRYDGFISLKDGLKLSKNTVALRLYERLGKEKIYGILEHQYGFDTLVRGKTTEKGHLTDLAASPLALGQLTEGVSLRKMTESYSVFQGGAVKRSRSYYAVFDDKGEILLENKGESREVLSENTAKLLTKLLCEVVNDGTARSISLKNYIDTAGKTGTSGGDRDKWFIGYTPYFTAGIWTGVTKGEGRVEGASHLRIWDEVMLKIHQSIVFNTEEPREFSSEGLLYLPYQCLKRKTLPDGGDESIIDWEWGYFTEDSLPENIFDKYGSDEI